MQLESKVDDQGRQLAALGGWPAAWEASAAAAPVRKSARAGGAGTCGAGSSLRPTVSASRRPLQWRPSALSGPPSSDGGGGGSGGSGVAKSNGQDGGSRSSGGGGGGAQGTWTLESLADLRQQVESLEVG